MVYSLLLLVRRETHSLVQCVNKAAEAEWIVFENTSYCLVAASKLAAKHDGLRLFVLEFSTNNVFKNLHAKTIV